MKENFEKGYSAELFGSAFSKGLKMVIQKKRDEDIVLFIYHLV